MTWLVGNPRFSLVAENRFWLVNGAGPIRPWSDFVGCDRVSRGWEQWGVSRTRLSWPMCWVLGAWFNMAKNVVLLCKVPVDKRCVLSWTVCDYLIFIIRASFETVKALVTHGRTQKTHGENIIIETSFHKRFLTSLKLMILLLVSQIENHSNDVIRPITRIKYQCKHGTIRPA